MTSATIDNVPAPAPLAATVDRDDLAAALKTAAVGLGRRPITPVLGGVLLETERGQLTVTCFNFETLASQAINAPGSRGAALVDARQLRAQVAALPRGAKITLNGGGNKLTLTSGEVTYTLPKMVYNDYPTIPVIGGQTLFAPGADTATLRRLAEVTVAAGTDDTLPMLTGIRVEVIDGMVAACCTDRYRLAVRDNIAEAGEVVSSSIDRVLIPARALQQILTALGRNTVPVTVKIDTSPHAHNPDWIHVVAGGVRISTRLLDATFPPYRSLLPTDAAAVLTVDSAGELLAAVRQAAVVVTGGNPIVMRLAAVASARHLRAGTSEDYDASAKVNLGAFTSHSGSDGEIGFSPKFLTEGLTCFDADDTLTLSFTSFVKPMLIRGENRPDFTYLLMPVRLATN